MTTVKEEGKGEREGETLFAENRHRKESLGVGQRGGGGGRLTFSGKKALSDHCWLEEEEEEKEGV